MSYCLNPNCQIPDRNSFNSRFCTSCGLNLLLKDRYRSQKLLGQGGFGKTFKAIDEDQPRKPLCVIKQFVFDNNNPEIRQTALNLFYEEAKHLESLGKHAQIPELLAYFDIDGQPYLVQEFIDGQDLAQELATIGKFDNTKIRELLASLLPILEFLHSRSIPIIHRDIKPANIIRRSIDNSLVLVDFGAAKQASQTILARTGTKIGSPEYSAPEQIRGKPTFASDIFSLGVTCIHLLTQVSPFDLFDINTDKWVWRDFLVNNPVDSELGKILDKMIANSLPCRYRSISDVLESLDVKTKPLSIPHPLLNDKYKDAQSYFKLARASCDNQNDYKQSLFYYNKAIELNPQYAVAYRDRGRLKEVDLDDIAGALADYNKAIELNPQDAINHYYRGDLKENELDDIAGALADYNKAIELNPQYAVAYRDRGRLKEVDLDDIAGALADYNKAIELNPQDAINHYYRGDLKEDELDDIAGALADYNKAIELDPQYAYAYHYRGDLKENKLNDIIGALADYNKAIELDPQYAYAYNNRGLLKENKLNDIAGALADYNKAIELDPQYAYAYYYRGDLKENKLNDIIGALADYNKAIKLNPQYAVAYRDRGRLKEVDLDDIAGALADYNKAIELNPQDAISYYCRGGLKEDELDDIIGALADYNQAIELDPQYSQAYCKRAKLKHYKLNKLNLAGLKRLLGVYKDRGSSKDENRNDLSGALADYNKAIELNSQYALAYYHRGILRTGKLKDRMRGIEDLVEAASLYQQANNTSMLDNAIEELNELGINISV